MKAKTESKVNKDIDLKKPKTTRKTTRKRLADVDVVTPCETSFFATALTVRGRFLLSWMLFKAGFRILLLGRAIV